MQKKKAKKQRYRQRQGGVEKLKLVPEVGSSVKAKVKGGSNSQELIGVISMFDPRSKQVSVNFGDGLEDVVLQLRDVTLVDDNSDIDSSSAVHPDQPGFYQYPIEWQDSEGNALKFVRPQSSDPSKAVRFRTRAEGVEFYGSWRKTTTRDDTVAYAIDLYALWEKKPYTLPPLFYYGDDPRKPRVISEIDESGREVESTYSGMRDLSSDVCAAINRWLYFHVSGNVQTITDLRSRAENPVLHFTSFDSLREAIVKLTNLYNRSSESGGFRTAEIKGTSEHDPILRVEVDLTARLISNNFRPDAPGVSEPPEPVGDMGKTVTKPTRSSKKSKTSTPVSGSLSELRTRLAQIQDTPRRDRSDDDERECKRLRASIRDKEKSLKKA